MPHPVEDLFAMLNSVEPFPKGVVALDGRIAGTAFFPGGCGLWNTAKGRPMPAMPMHGVMVLGQDFNSEVGFRESLEKGGEVSIDSLGRGHSSLPTWSTTIKTFSDFGIPLQRCFFTNAYMGLRDDPKNTGRFAGSKSNGFVERCRAFFRLQLDAQQPRLILSLGAWVPQFLAPISEQLDQWRGASSLVAIDAVGPVQQNVIVPGTRSASCSVVCLTHPSLRGPNVWRRHYGSLHGPAAERAMVADGIRHSGVDLRVV